MKDGHVKNLIKRSMLFAVATLTLTMSGGGGIAEAVSDSARTKVNFDVDPVISITAPESGNLEDPNNPGQPISPTQDGTIATFSEAVTVSTNNLTGYKLLMSMGTGSSNNALVSTTTPSNTIPSIAIDTTTTLANLPPNTWAYTLESGASATYRSLPDPLATQQDQKQHTIKADGQMGTETTNVSFATKVDMRKSAGVYQNSILYTATANDPPVLAPHALLCSNGNLEFVYDINHYNVGDPCISNDTPVINNTDTITKVYDTEHNPSHPFPYNPQSSSDIPWHSNNAITSANFSPSFYNYQPISTAFWFSSDTYLSTITNAQNFNISQVTDMYYMFAHAGRDASSFSLDLSGWNTSNVIDMSEMFTYAGRDASSFSLDLSGWNTSNVTDMSNMFARAGSDASSFSLEGLSNWDTSNVTRMYSMFFVAGVRSSSSFSLDLSSWDTSNVTNMNSMFYQTGFYASSFSLDLSSWDTSNVTNMSYMFYQTANSSPSFSLDLSSWVLSQAADVNINMSYMFYSAGRDASSFSLDLSSWDTSNVTNMSHMFDSAGRDASSFSLEGLSSWNVSNVTNMSYMFSDAGNSDSFSSLDLSGWVLSQAADVNINMSYMFYSSGVSTIYVGDGWNTSRVTNGYYMFFNATKLVGGQGTTYSPYHTDAEYARIDNPAAGQPGYFTGPINPTPIGGNTIDNVHNTYNNTSGSSDDGTTGITTADGYVAPQGVVNASANSSPNWFLIICLVVLSLGLLALIIFLIWKLRKQKKTATSA